MREKFPRAHGSRAEPAAVAASGRHFEIETFPRGAISAVIPSGPTAGVLLMVAGLLGDPTESHPHPELILIDGADTFDPGSHSAEACSKLLRVRCTAARQMMKAADAGADAGCPFVPRTGPADGDGRGGLFRNRGRRVSKGDGLQTE